MLQSSGQANGQPPNGVQKSRSNGCMGAGSPLPPGESPFAQSPDEWRFVRRQRTAGSHFCINAVALLFLLYIVRHAGGSSEQALKNPRRHPFDLLEGFGKMEFIVKPHAPGDRD